MFANRNHSVIKRDASILGRWWWTVDHWILGSVLLLTLAGIALSFSASPCVAERIGFHRFFFVKRHLIIVPLSLSVMFFVSLLSPAQIRKFASIMVCVGILALVITFFWGHEVKGAKRWLLIGPLSLQPSEFVKPALAVVVAWFLAEIERSPAFPGIRISLVTIGVVAALTLLQPDVGMTLVIVASGLIQLFVAGMPMILAVGLVIAAILGITVAYFCIPHVALRIDSFLHPEHITDIDQLYQIRQSLEAFHHGRWFGCGPGEGVVKRLVPDAHADFVFSVAGEEYGLFVCIGLTLLFSFLVIKAFHHAMRDNSNLFVVFSIIGLASQLGMQAFVNMSTTLRLIPTKGMTMPFVSYGGSSMLAIGIAMGMILALTRKRHGVWEEI